METDSLSCLRSVGGSVHFTFPYVLFKIYLLNLDTIELWQRLCLNLKRKMEVTLHFSSSFVYMLALYFSISIKPIQLCNAVDFSVHIVVTACRLCSYFRRQSKLFGKSLDCYRFRVFSCSCENNFKWERMAAYSISSVSLLESKGQRSGVGGWGWGFQLHRVCRDSCLCAVESILHCLVLCLCWRSCGISSHCK